MTRRFGLLGKDIEYSFSPDYFRKKFEQERIQDTQYLLYDSKDLRTFFDSATDLDGFNITIPYKEAVIPYLHSLSETAMHVGAVNTVKRTTRGWQGYNTDVYGFQQSLLPHLRPHHMRALLLGSGGASKAVNFALNQLSIETKVVSRSPEKADLAYADLSIDDIDNHTIIVNTTPLGSQNYIDMKPNIPYQGIGKYHLLYDLTYSPQRTLFLQSGEQNGAEVINGLRMLELQAEKSWEIWTEE